MSDNKRNSKYRHPSYHVIEQIIDNNSNLNYKLTHTYLRRQVFHINTAYHLKSENNELLSLHLVV